MDIKKKVESISDEIISIRREFHKYPELSGKEYKTMERICKYLDLWGIEYKKGIAETGVVAIVRGREDGKTIGLRADIDGLPIREENEIDYKSTNEGVMHACGHDAHIAILLGVAKIIKSMEEELKGNVKFFFQPAEETIGGAERMIKEGCLEEPYVDVVLGLHVSPNIDTGVVQLKYGKVNASSDTIIIVVKGKSAHGANPEIAVDPVVISANIIMALQTIVSRNISPQEATVFTVGSIHGGTKGNIIPEEVTMECILRTLDEDIRKYFKERIISIVEDISRAYGGYGQVIIEEGYPSLINNDEIVDSVVQVLEEVVGKENVKFFPHAALFAEDFAYFSQARKACYFSLGCRNEGKGILHPLHSSKFNIDEDCLKVGVEIQVRNILKLLNS
ncbi:MAG: amidohydrolase [Tissierellia bacterium]|nr:amidohydrolase [Tissierellia bacterium]